MFFKLQRAAFCKNVSPKAPISTLRNKLVIVKQLKPDEEMEDTKTEQLRVNISPVILIKNVAPSQMKSTAITLLVDKMLVIST